MKKYLTLPFLCFSALFAQDRLAQDRPHNKKFISNLKAGILTDRLGAGEVQVADNGDLIFPDRRGRQNFLYAVSPNKGLYRLSLNVVRTEKLSSRPNVFQGLLIKKDGVYRAGGITDYKKLKNKLDSLPVDDAPTRLALADSGWGKKAKYPWVFFQPPFARPEANDALTIAFISNLAAKKPVSYKYRMAASVNDYGDLVQTDGRGTLELQYALSPTKGVYRIPAESAGDLNIPSENAYKGFAIKSKGIYSTGYLLSYIYPKSKENSPQFMSAYGDRLNGEENINWKQLSRDPWFIYHKDPKTNASLNEAFLSKLRGGALKDNFSGKTVGLAEDGTLIFEALDAEVRFLYALNPSHAVYQVSEEYAKKRGFYSTNVFFGVIIKKDLIYTGSSRFNYEEPADKTDLQALSLFDERRKSIYNIDWEKPVVQPWITIVKE